jgi:hypothetical protein
MEPIKDISNKPNSALKIHDIFNDSENMPFFNTHVDTISNMTEILPTIISHDTIPTVSPHIIPDTTPHTSPHTIPDTIPHTSPHIIPDTTPHTSPHTSPYTSPHTSIETRMKLLELELNKYRELFNSNRDIIKTKYSEIESDTKMYEDTLDLEHPHNYYEKLGSKKDTLMEQHLKEIKEQYPCNEMIKFHNKVVSHIKEKYKKMMLLDLEKHKIIFCCLNKINSLLCIIYVNIYGDCFAYHGLTESNKLLFKYYPFPNIPLNKTTQIREIIPNKYIQKIRENKCLYFLTTDAFANTYDNTKKLLHIKPTFFGNKDANFFGPITLLNIWSIEKKRLFIKNEVKQIIQFNTTNELSIDELNVIQTNIIYKVKKFNIKLNILLQINYTRLIEKLAEFKIIGFYYNQDKKRVGRYKISNPKGKNEHTTEPYCFDRITINYIDIYGNSYNSEFDTVNGQGCIYNYSKHLYLTPFINPISKKLKNNYVDCDIKKLFELIKSKRYFNTQNIYNEFIFDRNIINGKIEIKNDLISHIKSKLESNDEFMLFYVYIAEQILLIIKFTSVHKMLEQTIHFFEKSIRFYKHQLYDYAHNKSVGLSDPSYIDFCK